MENTENVLKAVADGTRLKIVKLLLQHSYCVGALARQLNLTEAAISQHIKVLREADLLIGEKRGYFMHYDVNREQLRLIAAEFEELAAVRRDSCLPVGESGKQEKHCGRHEAENRGSDEI